MKHATRIALLVTIALFTTAERKHMSNKEIVRHLYEDIINSGHLERLSEVVSDEYVAADGTRGPAAFRAPVARLLGGFPNIHFTIEDLIGEGDRVAVRWRWEATHDGPFAGIAPTHKRITNSGIAIYGLRSGRIVSNWLESDRLGALQQLGVVPQGIGQPNKPQGSAAQR
jgi:predicted ester cyclase